MTIVISLSDGFSVLGYKTSSRMVNVTHWEWLTGLIIGLTSSVYGTCRGR